MEADHGQPATRHQRAFGGGKARDKLPELVVDPDADRLEGAGGGVALSRFRARQAGLDHVGQLRGAGQRAGLDDRARDPAGRTFLAIVIKYVGDAAFVRRVQQVRRGRPVAAHPHVERSVAQEGKAALGLVKLHGADAEIQHDTVHRLARKGVEVGKRPLDQPQPVAVIARPGLRHAEHRRVAVDADHAVGARVQQAARIAARAKGAVDPGAAHGCHGREQRTEQHRHMGCRDRHQSSALDSIRRTGAIGGSSERGSKPSPSSATSASTSSPSASS